MLDFMLSEDMAMKYVKENYILRLILTCLGCVLLGLIFIYISNKVENVAPKNILNNIGAILIFSGVYNIFYDAFLRKSIISIVNAKVNVKKSISETGLKEIYLRTDDIPYRSLIENSRERITIMHAYGKMWTLNNMEYIKKCCENKKIDLKVLLLNPDSPLCESLDAHYGNEKGQMKKSICEVTEKWKSFGNEIGKKSKISILYYDGNPAHSIYVFDDEMVIVPAIVTNELTKEIPNIYCTKTVPGNMGLYNAYLSELEKLEQTAELIGGE